MVPVHFVVDVHTLPEFSEAECEIDSISSNEPNNDQGDGNTQSDWMMTGPLSVDLRAERMGGGSGRIYMIDVECTTPDDPGVEAVHGIALVTVPVDG